MSAHARKAIADRQRQYQIKTLLSGNNHTLIQMSSAEFLDYLISVKMTEGLSRIQAIDWIDAKLDEHNALSAKWQRYKDTLKATVGLFHYLMMCMHLVCLLPHYIVKAMYLVSIVLRSITARQM